MSPPIDAWDPTDPNASQGGRRIPGTGPWRGRPGAISVKKSTSYGRPYQVVYGTCAVTGIPLWVYDKGDLKFKTLGPASAEQKGRAAEVQYAFSLGPIEGFDSLIYEKRLYAPSGGSAVVDYLGATNPPSGSSVPEFFLGDGSTTTWAHYASSGWETRIPWPMLALMRCRYIWVPDGAGTIPEIKGVLAGRFATHANTKRKLTGESWVRYDALPGDVIRDLIENAYYGLGLAAGTVVTDVGADGEAASSYDRYCTANKWFIALAVEDDASVADIIAQVLQATNSVGTWSEGHFKIVPLGDVAIGTGGTAYTPDLTAYAITDDDIVIGSGDPIRSRRRAWSDCYNVIPVEYSCDQKNRDAELAVSEDLDVANAATFKVRRGEIVSLPCIRSAVHAQNLSGILARRSCYSRTTFEFTLSPRHGALLECADLVAITSTVMGLSAQLARIDSIEEDEEGNYLVSAVEWVTGASVTVENSPQTADGYATNVPTLGRDNYASISAMSNDSIFSVSEHAAALRAWDDLQGSSADLVSKADAAGVGHSTWSEALTALGTYLNAGTTWTSGTPAWLTSAVDVAIVPATWRANWAAAYGARSALLNAITAKKTTTTYSGTAPSYPATGDIWWDTSSSPLVLHVWDGSAWVHGPTGAQGPQGTQGVQGPAGDDGVSHYFHVAYAYSANGATGFNQTSGPYIGTYVDHFATDSGTYTDYTWRQFVGAQGAAGDQGIPGVDGTDGSTSYLHIKYSDNGSTFTANSGETPGKWIGTYVDFTATDSTTFGDYTWKKIEGPQGETGAQGPQGTQGTQGPAGADGASHYFHVAYATAADGSTGFNQTSGPYIGTYVDHVATDSGTYTDYTWRQFVGSQGATGGQGVAGTDGTDGNDGTTYYLHLKYSDDGSTFTASSGETPGKWLGQRVDTNPNDSTTFADYTWAKTEGPTGPTGGTGSAGARGSIHFYADKSSDGPGEIWTAGSPWEDACANYYMPAGGPIFMDQCTQFDGAWAETRYWDSGWVPVSVVIDGNLLVNGSVAASKLVADSIQTSDYTASGSGASEVASVGARMRNNSSTSGGTLPAIITSPAGIKIGNETIDQTWFWKKNVTHAVIYAANTPTKSGDFTAIAWESDGTNYRLKLSLTSLGSFATAMVSWYSTPPANYGMKVIGAIDKVWIYFYLISTGAVVARPDTANVNSYINVWAMRE